MSDPVHRRADRAIERARHTVSAAELAIECARYARSDAGLRRILGKPPTPDAARTVPDVHPVSPDDAIDATLGNACRDGASAPRPGVLDH